MSGSPSSSGSNPRKFSEKIALHNQKQAEETRAFEQLMTDLTVSRVQFQKLQQLRLSQGRAQCYGGSLPNVNQIGHANTEFQGPFPSGLDSGVRGTRHHGLVERVHRERNRINSPHRRPLDKHGRQISFSLSPQPQQKGSSLVCSEKGHSAPLHDTSALVRSTKLSWWVRNEKGSCDDEALRYSSTPVSVFSTQVSV
ncbi:hypothetical protein AALO_G00189710 [Alosa alosa]|uniref:Transducer of regulated CREB activity N-terminal domain-containing protein n=1 Tax=Alosa alosa TaxID=278164 RepID=A0AAV6G7V2_9TELE|nr:hypothetical protein AALO_G00189710 [Alosa alosa]